MFVRWYINTTRRLAGAQKNVLRLTESGLFNHTHAHQPPLACLKEEKLTAKKKKHTNRMKAKSAYDDDVSHRQTK